MGMKLIDYKDFEIEVSVSGKFFTNGISEVFDKFEDIKAEINRVSAFKYVPVDGIMVSSMNAGEVLITRPHQSSYNPGNPYFWVTNKKTKRKQTTTNVVLKTPENVVLFEKWTNNIKRITELHAENNDLFRQMKEVPIVLEKEMKEVKVK